MDWRTVSSEVDALAASDDPVAPMVREALHVISEALASHGCVRIHSSAHLATLTLTQGQIRFP